MPKCVLSSQNRFYVDLEASYGQVPAVTADERIAAIQLGIRQALEARNRRDKTGSRTYAGVSPGARKRTEFNLQTYLLTNPSPGNAPSIGPLVQASLGAAPLAFGGGSAGSGSTTTRIVFSAGHGLVKGQAFGFNGELRFVSNVVDSTTVDVNAAFSAAPASGETLTAAVSYFPAEELPSVAVFDYWDPAGALDRLLVGSSCGRMQVKVNGDYHELEFLGEAQDVIDSASFTAGQGGLSAFPDEPAPTAVTELPIPGNLGQAWLGSPASKFQTLTNALIEVDNDLDLRNREFGTDVPQCVAPGIRRVTADFELFEMDDAATQELYVAAREESVIQVMFQLGQADGQLMGVYLPAVVPQAPVFDDRERILKWSFESARAQGAANDEVVAAFG